MTELIILTAFAPLIFLPFPAFKRLTQVWGWTAIAIAALCNGYFIFLHREEPLLWAPAGAFLSVFLINLIGQGYRRGLSTLAVLFVSQALLTDRIGSILILLALADTFLGAELFLSSKVEEKNRAVQSLYQSALSLLPTALGLLLRLDGDALTACVAVSVALRLFSWPINQWIVEISGDNKMFPTYVGIVSSFALWHIQEFRSPELWSTLWLGTAALFSLGAKYTEMYAALSMGLIVISTPLGILAACLWPLLARPSYTIVVVALLTAAIGGLVADSTSKILLPQAAFALAGLAGIFVARVFVGTKIVKTKWHLPVLDAVFALVWAGLLFYFAPMAFKTPDVPAMVFAGAFVAACLLGMILKSKKPKIFQALPAVPAHIFTKEMVGAEFLAEKRGDMVELPLGARRLSFFESVESEAYVIFLFGILGALLVWGQRFWGSS